MQGKEHMHMLLVLTQHLEQWLKKQVYASSQQSWDYARRIVAKQERKYGK